ncbi:MAG: hypothetical protein NXI02_08230 [Rhodobacteraceae bacterium]|nr:hypothetical protein [Paracoccaceae bacterium]
MARFPYFQRNVAALGRLLAHARLDPAKFDKLKTDPQLALAELGLPSQVTSLMEFAVIDDEDNNSIALPFRLNQERLREYNRDYLLSLATTFSQNPSETGTVSEEKPLH